MENIVYSRVGNRCLKPKLDKSRETFQISFASEPPNAGNECLLGLFLHIFFSLVSISILGSISCTPQARFAIAKLTYFSIIFVGRVR